MKKAKRLTAFVMMVMLVVSLLPATSFAASKKSSKKLQEYSVTVKYRYDNGKTAAKSYKETYTAGKTTKTVKVAVPQKKGYAVKLAKRTGAAARSNVTVKLNSQKTVLSYKVKKINANITFRIIYKKLPAPVEPEYPAQTFEVASKADGVELAVNAPEGAFPEGTQMNVQQVSASDKYTALDFDFVYGGKEIEPAVPVEVIWESDKIVAGETWVIHFKDNGTKEVVPAKVTDGKAAFVAESFSTYVTTRLDTIDLTQPYSSAILFKDAETGQVLDTRPASMDSGELASTAPAIEGYTYVETKYQKNGQPENSDKVVYLGAFEYEDETDPSRDGTYVYFKTESNIADNNDLIVELAEDETIYLYYKKAPNKVKYQVVYNGTTYTVGVDPLPSDLAELLIEGPAYAPAAGEEKAVNVAIPRGFSATVSVSGRQTSNYNLGQEPTYSLSSDNKTITRTSSYTLDLDDAYDLPAGNSEITVTVNLTKRDNYTFNARYFLGTVYAGGAGVGTLGDTTITGNNGNKCRVTTDAQYSLNSNTAANRGTRSFTEDGTIWAFNTVREAADNIPAYGDEWTLDALEINETTIELPYSQGESKVTTLPSGTEITVTLDSISSSAAGNSGHYRHYTLSVNNCYENIVITGGNIVNAASSTEIIPEVLDNVTYDFYGFSTADNAYSSSVRLSWITGWGVGQPIQAGRGNAADSGSYDMYKFGQTNNDAMRFSVPAGYTNPEIAFESMNGTELISNVQLGSGLRREGQKTSDGYYPIIGNPTNGYYYFRISGMSNEHVGLLRIRASLMRYGVSYAVGESEITNYTIPGYDNGGYYDSGDLRGYNIEDNDYVVLDDSAPVDNDNEYVFLYYTIDGDSSGTHYAPSQKIPLSSIAGYAEYNESEGEYVIPFVAHWEKKDEQSPISFKAEIYLDNVKIKDVVTTVPQHSSIYVDIDSNTMQQVMDEYNWQLFYDEMGSEPFVRDVTEENNKVEIRLYSKFYVYHSSDNTLELHTTKELEQEDGTFGKLDISKLVKSGYLYGGYYKDYAGGHAGNDAAQENLVKKAADTNNDTGTLSTNDIKTLSDGGAVTIPEYTGGTAYTPATKDQTEYWKSGDAFTKDTESIDPTRPEGQKWYSDRGSQDTAALTTGGKGTQVQIARAGIYYLKEVPDTYIRPAQMTTYQKFDKHLRDFILLSTTDDTNYKTVGFKVGADEYDKEKAPEGEFFYTDKLEITFGPNFEETTVPENGEIDVTTKEVSQNKYGYVISYRLFSLNEASTPYNYEGITGTKLVKPYWVTPDGIKVIGAAMRRQVVKDISGNGVIEVPADYTSADAEIKWTDYKIKSILE